MGTVRGSLAAVSPREASVQAKPPRHPRRAPTPDGSAASGKASPPSEAEGLAREVGVDHYLHERYAGHARNRLLALYYACKPLIPRRAQLAMRRRYAVRQGSRSFPAWPIEPILVERWHEELCEKMRTRGEKRVPFVGFWPEGHRFAVVLTHDVEGPTGVANIERVREIERRHGFVSSWNFVAEDYRIPPGTFERLEHAGCEVGLHGITHDGKLFQSRARFEADLPKIHACLAKWPAVGFRSPATHRRADWMHELGCLYDSSFPDTDPFEPQSGGCCSILPFQFRELVELPITLVQDHTLLEILRQRTIELWVRKSEWIIDQHGLINLITHPDYLDTPDRLALYDEFLSFLRGCEGGWHALPREVAQWWKARAQLVCAQSPQGAMVEGPDGAAQRRATLAWASELDGKLRIEI
jgi:peptidoglycan/xylan/chitin deacetylase (PgdA/CDA1 family)